MLVPNSRCWWPDLSSTFKSSHQHIWSPTPVTKIDVTFKRLWKMFETKLICSSDISNVAFTGWISPFIVIAPVESFWSISNLHVNLTWFICFITIAVSATLKLDFKLIGLWYYLNHFENLPIRVEIQIIFMIFANSVIIRRHFTFVKWNKPLISLGIVTIHDCRWGEGL